MKRIVWKNKFNGQFCVTIPKEAHLKEGDLVKVNKAKIKRISYIGVVADLFHYGHLHSILFAKSISDRVVCGIFTDEAVEEYRIKPIANFEERKAIVENLRCVDQVMVQEKRDSTDNLRKIHEEFPDAEIILIHGDDLSFVHGEEYIKSIGGKIVKHPYYTRLSNFKILNYFLENKDKFKDITKFTSFIKNKNIDAETKKGNKVIISSKAETLKALQPLLTKSKIEPLYSFTISDWKNKKNELITAIKEKYSPAKIIVRSSAVNEDTLDNSLAGYFDSALNVNSENQKEIEKAVKKVLHSYKEKQAESSFNQVLVQKQTANILMSGVVFTRTIGKNAPYYVINYDDKTGSSDSVTSGKESKMLIIYRFAKKVPPQFQELLKAVKEIEERIPELPLDIEFALNKDKEVILFQVRPLAANIHKEENDAEIKDKLSLLSSKFKRLAAPQNHIVGETTIFADMSDWNPAEIIGDNPNYLDYSIYDYIITNSAWHEARTSQGYYNVNPAKLVELFGNKPYVNVRNSFNSFTPAPLSHLLRSKLVSFYLLKLKNNPYLQDKVEFDIVHTCYDLTFDRKSKELKEAGFSTEEIQELKTELIKLTNNLVLNSPSSIQKDLQDVLGMEEKRKQINSLTKDSELSPAKNLASAKILLDDCRKNGTAQFSRLARLGFIAKIILKSLVQKNIVSQEFSDNLYNSLSTVATKISDDFRKLLRGELSPEKFRQDYYHLRPGTYDITSLRYDANSNFLQNIDLKLPEQPKANFILDSITAQKITVALSQEGLNFNADQFLNFVKVATEARELSKFEFTKNLSDALELIAAAGEAIGFARRELALLDINEIFRIGISGNTLKITRQWKELLVRREKERKLNEKLALPSIIFSTDDFEIIEHYSAKPNFITQKKAAGKIINLNEINSNNPPHLEGSIVVLENGDPGYDWIFTQNLAGLITKYGGIASHMSIRCAEFGIPAAIGCGELIFNKVKTAAKVELDCRLNKIIPLGG